MSRARKTEKLDEEVTVVGSEFQTKAHEREKARSPWVIVRKVGTVRARSAEDRRLRLGR